MKHTPPKNESMDLEHAEEFFQKSNEYAQALSDFMEAKGYKWSRNVMMYVDDGSLARDWADNALDHEAASYDEADKVNDVKYEGRAEND